MSLNEILQDALRRVEDQQSFFDTLLGNTLGWPTRDVDRIEDIAYGWTGDDLKITGLDRALLEGSIWQIQPAATGQPWGIFVLRFNRPDLLSPHQGMAGILRAVLRGLVGSRRKDAKLPSWKREHLLFVCTYDWQSYRFCYFRPKPDDPKSARLTTFGWSPGTSNRTVCEFNLPSLFWPEDTADALGWVELWSRAFDKEPLTKDFFKRFDGALDSIKSDLEVFQGMTSAEAYTQAQLLLERLIFIYFLQNRGWLDQSRTYVHDKLADHLSSPSEFSYYSEFLDKVFWTLSSAPGEAGRLPGIPFLNGGLFDDDDFRQPGNQRKTNPPLKVRNSTLQIVFRDLFEAFNFTVTEDTPLNEEVAVDPEMLGKVFESIVLHAEAADPDAVAPDKRKATGSYYTPRIVVHFICREVLYQYLHARLTGEEWAVRLRALLEMDASDIFDEASREYLKRVISPDQAAQLRDIVVSLKCCDPAVGSGAFPVGLLHELVNFRRVLITAANGYVDPVRREGSVWLHDTKESIVQNSLFGVDIQQQAIEICRLRLWLSLIVDYDIGLDPFTAERGQFATAIQRISQLPNLEINFHRGDSLHDHICGVPIVILPNRASRYSAELRAISKLGQDLHKAKRAERKKMLRLSILEKRLDLSRRILNDEHNALRAQDSALDNFFGLEESAAKKRERLTREIGQLSRAMKKVEADRVEMERLKRRVYDNQFYPKLRKLEGADFDSPFNFAWTIDFPGIFGGENSSAGFDIIVGNPPFVTARNPNKRELWRERWPRVCAGTYQLVCPFFELSFGLLRAGGQLGFIVSNAFAKREFGKPLIEKFFPVVALQKIVDCSGLSFPGHGTPTCLVFGRATKPSADAFVRVSGIKAGGGDLRTPPEESSLWQTLAEHNDQPGFEDHRIVVADRPRSEMAKWPLNLDASTEGTLKKLESHCGDNVLSASTQAFGSMFDTHKDDAFMLSGDCARRHHIEKQGLAIFSIGDQIRNWQIMKSSFVLKPYDAKWQLLSETTYPHMFAYLRQFRRELGGRATFGGGTYDEAGQPWYRYHQVSPENITATYCVVYPEISTHGHFIAQEAGLLFTQTAPLIRLRTTEEAESLITAALLNSSSVLFWLKIKCFNKGAGEDEHLDRFEYAGAKVSQVPTPSTVAEALNHASMSGLSLRLTALSKACIDRGRRLVGLTIRRLFEKQSEAYHQWNNTLPGHRSADSAIGLPFETVQCLRESYNQIKMLRNDLRCEMVALQEEMDWLVYAAYGLLPFDHPAIGFGQGSGKNTQTLPEPVEASDRPFKLWERAGGNYAAALESIPVTWSAERRALWQARLGAIEKNPDIMRIEQPVYKRRWDEQWKVGSQWRSGAIAYAAEFLEAFEWWLSEKAEWWLEHRKSGGPVEFNQWAEVLWRDDRIQAAWGVAVEEDAFVRSEKANEKAEIEDGVRPARIKPKGDFANFAKYFKRIIDEQTVPDNVAWAVPYEELERKRKVKVPVKVRSVRGKLNAPRERPHQRDRTMHVWAGLQSKTKR